MYCPRLGYFCVKVASFGGLGGRRLRTLIIDG